MRNGPMAGGETTERRGGGKRKTPNPLQDPGGGGGELFQFLANNAAELASMMTTSMTTEHAIESTARFMTPPLPSRHRARYTR